METTADPLVRRNSPAFGQFFPEGRRPADSTLSRWIRAHTFPAPLKPSSRYCAWRLSELRAWQRGEWRPAR